VHGTATIHDQVLIALRRIIRRVDMHSRSLAQKHGLTGPQLLLLRELSEKDERSVGSLAKTMSLSSATVSGIVDRLSRRGMVQRVRGGTDRRNVMVKLTDDGRTALEKAPPLLQEQFMSEFEGLRDWEQSQILSSLQRVASMMEADHLDATPILMSGPPVATAKSTVEFLAQAAPAPGDSQPGTK
jgi:DNA-binding MarR family transcriptional regulator